MLSPSRSTWTGHGTLVEFDRDDDGALRVFVTSDGDAPGWIAVGWRHPLDDVRVFGDAWERSYGELAWQPVCANRVLPWYWLAHDAGTGRTRGAGVRVGAAAMCSWIVDSAGVTCWLDLRNGGGATRLGGRRLHAATIVEVDSVQPPFATAGALVRELGGKSRAHPPVVGANNWYYAYGQDFDAQAVLRDAETISNLAGDHPVRPFAVVDAGWSPGGTEPGGPWEGIPGTFDDMPGLAEKIRATGARPGIWFRPLLSRVEVPETRARRRGGWVLDPSLPETLARVEADAWRLRGWGFDLIKHDFSTFDMFDRWGRDMGVEITDPGWSFARRDRTNAEILLDVYRAIRRGAGDAVLIGCNTVGHLAAGLVDVQRIGDDTSGRAWERTRRMGINALAFRLPQHHEFFVVDADCVAVTPATPWHETRALAELIAASGTALFLSLDPLVLDGRVEQALRPILTTALDGGAGGGVEPLDWLTNVTPTRWRIGDEHFHVDWFRDRSGMPFADSMYP
ncbi:hypothetical protein ACWEOO_34145 [Kribbella sp. NPDC004138]